MLCQEREDGRCISRLVGRTSAASIDAGCLHTARGAQLGRHGGRVCNERWNVPEGVHPPWMLGLLPLKLGAAHAAPHPSTRSANGLEGGGRVSRNGVGARG